MRTRFSVVIEMYAPSNVKRQKTVRDAGRPATESLENFQGVGRIDYKPEAAYSTEDNFYFRYYNASERVHGRAMEDWLRPSAFLGHGFTPYMGCVQRPWCDNQQTAENYKKGVRAMFELCIKLGLKFWSGYDRDIAPEGDTLEETNSNLDQVVELLNEYQQKTGIRPLWIGVDFKSHTRYRNGAATNSDANIVAYAGYQVKRTLEIAHKLNAECFMISCEQEGYENAVNTDVGKELKHYARFLKMVIEQRDKIGYRGQLLLQTAMDSKNKNRYNYDMHSTLSFLKHYNYDRYFKLNVRPGHDFIMANVYGSVGCVDIKHGDLSDVSKATLFLRSVVENGGIAPGGLTFYMPSHRSNYEAKDLAEGFISSVDTFAKALRFAIKLVNDVQINKSIQMRYLSFSTGWGAKFMSSDAALDECEEYIKKLTDMQPASVRSDHWSAVLTRYMDAPLK